MVQRAVLLKEAGHQAFATLVADDLPAGGGAVASVNGQTGVVVLDAGDVGAQPSDSDLAAIAALSTTSYGRAFLALADAAAGRTALGLGTAATASSGAFDAAGAAAAAQAASQPLDSDLTALAALSTAAYGRSVLEAASAAALRTLAGLGTAAVAATGDFDAAGVAASAVSTHAGLSDPHPGYLTPAEGAAAYDAIGAAAAAQAASQPLDSDLTAFAGLAIAADKLPYGTGSHALGLADLTAAGRALIDDADAAAQRTTLGLGTAAVAATGDFQAADAELAAVAGLVSAANKLPYFTGSGAASLADLSAAGRAIIDDADAAAQRATLGLGSLATASSLAHSATTGQTANDHHAQSHNHSAVGDSTALLPATLLLPNSAGITLPTTEGYIGEDSTPHNVLVYDSQRQRVVGEVGWMPYAYPPGYHSYATINTTQTLAAAGGSIATPIYVAGHMLLQQLRFRQQDASLLRTAEWQLYVQYLNNGNAGENTLAAVTGAYGTISFTPSAASTQTSTATGAPVYLGPGVYWIVIRNTHASNTFGLAGGVTGTLQNDIAQTKTLGSALGSTLDFVAASWSKIGTGPLALILEGRVFGQTAAF